MLEIQTAENMQHLINLHSDFWSRSNAQPLLHRIAFAGYKAKPYPVNSGGYLDDPAEIAPPDIDVDRLLGLDRPAKAAFDGNAFNWLGPVYSEAWMEAFIGCRIFAGALGCTAKTFPVDLPSAAKAFDVNAALNSDWVRTADSVLARSVETAGDRIAVRQLHLRGIIDMLAAFLGEEKLCTSIYDEPGYLAELASKFSELYIRMARRGIERRSLWQGGSVSSWNIYAPGQLLDYQLDASNMFSASVYQEIFLPFDKAVLDRFKYSLVHLHACGLHILEPLLSIESIGTVEISLDRETAKTDLCEIINAARICQQFGKSVLLYGELTQDELLAITAQLKPNGLAVLYWLPF